MSLTAAAHNPDNRMTFGDDVFFRSSVVAESHPNIHYVWWFSGGIPTERLRELHRQLQQGPLSRLGVRPRVYGARGRWVPAPPDQPFIEESEPVTDALAWADKTSLIDLDLVNGPGWALVTAPYAHGGTLVAILTSHAISDGAMMAKAVEAAVRGEPIGILPNNAPEAQRVSLGDDLKDALRQWRKSGRALRRTLASVRNGRLKEAVAASDQPHPHPPPRPSREALRAARSDRTWLPPMTSVSFSASQWRAAAARANGTPNVLFIAVLIGVLVDCGRVQPGKDLTIGTPMASQAPETELDGNTSLGLNFLAPVSEDRYQDLSGIRMAAKARYAGHSDGSQPHVMSDLRPLMALTPDWAIKLGSEVAQSGVCTASNLGAFSTEMATLGHDRPADRILCRGVNRGLSDLASRSSNGGLTGWINQCGETMTLSVWGMDPGLIPDRAALNALLAREFERWDVEPEFWDEPMTPSSGTSKS